MYCSYCHLVSWTGLRISLNSQPKICWGYLEVHQWVWDGSFEHPKHIFNSLYIILDTPEGVLWQTVNAALHQDLNRICTVCKGSVHNVRDQARGRLGRNSRPRGRNFALNGTQGEVGVSLKKKKKKKKFFFFLRRLIFILSPHKCKLWWHYQTIYYHCIVFLLPLNGNSMCNG